jgi:hypothetical protein
VVAAGAVVVVEVLELLEQAVATSANVPSAMAAAVFLIPLVVLRTGEPPRSSWLGGSSVPRPPVRGETSPGRGSTGRRGDRPVDPRTSPVVIPR